MEDLSQKVSRILSQAFPGADVRFEQDPPASRPSGEVVWDGFEGVEQADRQHRLRQVLAHGLSPEERNGLSIILTFTPNEIAVMEEEAGPLY